MSAKVVPAGFEFFPPGSRQLVTVFSAVNYCGQFDNAGAMLLVEEDLTCSFRYAPFLSIRTTSFSSAC